MTNVVLDTSVIIKWFSPEENEADKALSILEAVHSGQISLVFPHFIQLEIANILRLGKNFPQEKTNAFLINFFDLEPDFVEIDQGYTLEISKISYVENIASYDSSFVAVSGRKNIPLITADYKHHQKSISKNIVWLKEWNGKL